MSILQPLIDWISDGRSQTVSLDQAIAGTGCPRKPMLRALDLLAREGWLEEISDCRIEPRFGECGPPRRNPVWRVLRDPRKRPKTRVLRKSARSRIWKLIRAKCYFTKVDLMISANTSESSVDEYVRLLARAGYIRKTGKDGRLDTFMLVRRDQVDHPPLVRENNDE